MFGICLFTTSLVLTIKLFDFILKYVQITSYCLWIEQVFTFCYILWKTIKIKLTYFCLSLPLCCCFLVLHLLFFKSYLLIFLMLFRYQHPNIFYYQPYSASLRLRSLFSINKSNMYVRKEKFKSICLAFPSIQISC